ncbi:hypothetical protein K469DRAFT_72839 [Zopfia rhizophila CBS 207.26]|uniref:ARS-binding protein 1 N-terminal domain-containing protein n=1 Tax=Zopfia rhizophila CBS 207.26 TaxID=1314779 RepID=A0A6A6EFK1_9PEZI|nr:hypothetical protein K469DRAFT_72839 [Zopfia rhizophila CBS 207.26]
MAELSHLQNFYLRRFTINRLPYLNYRTIESTLMPPKAISDVERQALRAYYFSQKPQPKQKDIIAWFEQQYGRKLGQATTVSLTRLRIAINILIMRLPPAL